LALLVVALSLKGNLLAQAPPLEVQVWPSVQQARPSRTKYSTDPYSDAIATSSQRTLTSYTIQLSRAMMPLSGVKVHWAILVQAPGSDRLRLVQGERVCNVPIRDAVTIKTEAITTSVTVRSTANYAEYPYNNGSTVGAEPGEQIKGYEVEVFVNGSLAVLKVEPPSVQQQVESMRAAPQPGPAIPPPPPRAPAP
jgi:hypothetical protein